MKQKNFILTVLLADYCLCGTAQFYTVTSSCAIQKEMSLEEETRTTDSVQYMDVSYPLKRMMITSSYGTRKDPYTGKKSPHNGIDLRAKFESVFAMFTGTITKVSEDARSGKYIILSCGDFSISYCHLSTTMVREGQMVQAGEQIAISGNTGRSTGPHLHLTCRYRHECIDPSFLLSFIKEHVT